MSLKITLAQINFLVGDIAANSRKIIQTAINARDQLGADICVFSELAVTGYPPEDLLFRPDFIAKAAQAVTEIANNTQGIDVVLGFPEATAEGLYNSAAVLREGAILCVYRKNCLPNYGVFDERRYFKAGHDVTLFTLKNTTLALTICEDIWCDGMLLKNRQAGADIVLTLNASPFHAGKMQLREEVVRKQVKQAAVPLIYVNQVGGQDELIFDGASFVLDQHGVCVMRAAEFKEQLCVIEFINQQPQATLCAPLYDGISSIYQALVLGIRDYVTKNGFQGALLGLSGGIDSALVLALAVDALGAEKVEAVLMPSCYTQDMSTQDAITQAKTLGVRYQTIPIMPAVNAFTEMLAEVFANTKLDATEENIQARCRGVILMALSNKQGKILLTTGNKSEMSVGYATLYGDMAGGFAPIKDVPKLLVYALSRYRNSLSAIIPARVIERPPSAELAPNQVDADSLPIYENLDPILERYIALDQSADEIIAAGFKPEEVRRAISLVDRNEYKRRQSPPGIKITTRAFGRDRRFPITSGYRGVDSQ
ncbi:MAG: NAD+ synthase [Methylococcaceae bacterium]|nr:NAD+ synthase [Methylococcaceae bacterium]